MKSELKQTQNKNQNKTFFNQFRGFIKFAIKFANFFDLKKVTGAFKMSHRVYNFRNRLFVS